MSESLYASRLTFGRRFGDPAPIPAGGAASWLAAQLAASPADTADVSAALAAKTVTYPGRAGRPAVQRTPAAYRMTAAQAEAFAQADGAVLDVDGGILSEMQLVWLTRAAYSANQLFERVVDFWHDHFALDLSQAKTERVRRFLPAHDRVIRANALGNFAALLLGVARSPVMMTDLDLAVSAAPQPNENYAREVMELHTLGVAAYLGPTTPAGQAGTGYSDADVTAAAAVLSGWTFDSDGAFVFVRKRHLGTPAAALGQSFSGAGALAGEQLLQYLATHPSTARHIATKLYVRFVADAVPSGSTLLPAMTAAFAARAGAPDQIAQVVGLMARHPEFLASTGAKLKTPRHLAASVLRASGADFDLVPPLLGAVSQFGWPIYDFPTPNGPPDAAAAYVDAASLLKRWSLGAQLLDPSGDVVPRPGWPHDADRKDALDAALAGGAPAEVAARLAAALLGPAASAASLAAIQAYASSSEGIAARMLAAPDDRLRAALARVAGAAMSMPEFQVC